MAASLLGRMARTATIEVPGGSLGVNWRSSDGHVTLAGPASRVFEGQLTDLGAMGVRQG